MNHLTRRLGCGQIVVDVPMAVAKVFLMARPFMRSLSTSGGYREQILVAYGGSIPSKNLSPRSANLMRETRASFEFRADFAWFYSVDDCASFDCVRALFNDIHRVKGTDDHIPIVLIANKTDLVSQVSREEGIVECAFLRGLCEKSGQC